KIDFITLVLKPTLDMRGAWVDMTTERDGMSMTLHADWVVKVPGFHKIPTDFSHIFQADRIIQTVSRPENVNLPPFTLPYPGLFVIPGSRFLSNRSFALQEVAEYLQREILVEKGRALVDEEKCVLCLTCLRTCPWSAIDTEGNSRRKKARINWEQCHLCGLCLSSCPADAISLEGLTECYEIIQQ
ncbi:MAG: 4Fe-4S binding protein, partial [Atribacterota bacterium]